MSENLSPSLVLGTVAEIQRETDGLQVRLQRLDHPEGVLTDWLRVASPMAGNGYGFCFVPEAGDLAVAAFQGVRPIVLGFIYGGGSATASTDPVERVISSVDGNALVLVDGQNSGITLRDKHGNQIVMDSSGISITTDKDLNISAGGTTTVQGTTVELNP
ncbi:phage baseplate assembly protein V [Glutamicibacter sp. MNS18]|uniref:phage baseplate assembly protein V n=1 Tax=Glutamicibacter sp. MNS18 TaxID=2989817 RepID=UPI00223654A8|nr:phage baseplate assembly protein V [Glutamicibacter sp. MNS18]MCW4464561.1 phage baseplate assembly protein V [Glutamicibacter sp. MNS18]